MLRSGRITSRDLDERYGIPEVNGERLLDGGVYGMLFNSDGVAIGPFVSEIFRCGQLAEVELQSVTIKSVKSAPVHTVGVRDGDGQSIGFQGEVWSVFEFLDGDRYSGTPMTDLLVLLAELS